MQQAITWAFDTVPDELGETLSSLVNTWYDGRAELPPEVLLAVCPPDLAALSDVLAERRGTKVALRVPQRGDKKRLVEIATENARSALARAEAGATERDQALQEIRRACQLARAPRRMECFDNSNIQGSDPVAAMAVFVDGQPARGEYRRYRVKTVVGSDDYASMTEILTRRLTRGLQEGTLPDLIVVDGGKGQLNVARAVFADLGIAEQRQQAAGISGQQPVVGLVGLAKPRTEPAGRPRGRRQDRSARRQEPGSLVRVLPHLRMLRPSGTRPTTPLSSTTARFGGGEPCGVLDQLPGVGVGRRKALLKHFGSMAAIQAASADELAAVPGFGPALAQSVWEGLRKDWSSTEAREEEPV